MGKIKALLAAALIFTSATAISQSKERVVISEQSFAGSKAVSYVLKAVIETRLGGEVEIKLADTAVATIAMDKGDGQIDVISDFWMPNHNARWFEYVEQRKTVLHNNESYSGIQRLWIPGYMQDEHGIYSFDDLKKPEIAKLFDTDGNGLGEYWPGAPGWGSTQIWMVKMRTSGLDELFEHTIVDQAVFLNKLDSDYKKKLPLLFYYWTPEWVPQAYDIRPLKEAPFTGYKGDNAKDSPLYAGDKGCFELYNPRETQDWLERSHITCQNPDAEIWVLYSKTLVDRAPKAAQFLKQVKLDPVEVSKWIGLIARDQKDAQDMAEEWVLQNKEIVDEWIKGIM
jgi:glycine betaine/proline transport system substrate-binding protein